MEPTEPVYIRTTTAAVAIAAWLLYESQRFSLEPLPWDWWELHVQPDVRVRVLRMFTACCGNAPDDPGGAGASDTDYDEIADRTEQEWLEEQAEQGG